MLTSVMFPLLLGTAFALQPPGTFHAGEAVARDGEPWLALRVGADGEAALVVTTLAVRPVEDALVDGPGERTGVEVTTIDAESVIAFVRGTGLQAGPIERAQVNAGNDAPPPSSRYRVSFRGLAYRIDHECDPEPAERIDGQVQYACRVLLRTPDASHVLARMVGYFEPGSAAMSFGDDGAQQLLFAGDLDRDGRLDLIYDTSDHYNVSRPALFLSTQAGDGAPLREVAQYESVGC